MLTKLLIASALGTSAVGTGVATGMTPTGIELAAGPMRIETGNGHVVSARLAEHMPFSLTINLQGDTKLCVKF